MTERLPLKNKTQDNGIILYTIHNQWNGVSVITGKYQWGVKYTGNF